MLFNAFNPQQPIPAPLVLQVVGFKNSGKTTLIAKLVIRLKRAGYIVGTIKHDAHEFNMDSPGTDTWHHQDAGADITAISSATRSAIISKGPETLSLLLAQMWHVDIVLVEGFKHEDYPKIILLRNMNDQELLKLSNPYIAVTWPEAEPLRAKTVIPVLSIDEEQNIIALIFDRLSQASSK